MTTQQIEPLSKIITKGFDISIGREQHQIALISQSTGDFTKLTSIRKGGRLAQIKKSFKPHLCSTTHFFFEHMTTEDIDKLIKLLN